MSEVVAIIPARGGSKRIPRKNLIELAGAPVLAHSIRHAHAATAVGAVYVSTDDGTIADLARAEGATVVGRPADISDDTAPSEAALTHVLDVHCDAHGDDPELVVFLQATSPVRRPRDIDTAVDALRAAGADSLFSACHEPSHVWRVREGCPESVTYDWRRRAREQEMKDLYRENGSIYVFKPSVLRETGNRLGGRMVIFPMDYWSSFQLDSPEHLELLRWIMERNA
jgi:CMP-N,N'-diacetyllegionaminic acid synthase